MSTRGIYIKNLLDSAQGLNTLELDDFVNKLLAIRAKRVANVISKKESELLLKINIGLSDTEQLLFNHLIEKRDAETITNEAFEQLVELTDKSEALNVQRMKALVELSKLRGVTLSQLMADLNIKPQ
jgi:hypothetical protein